ncbi:MAG: signal peptidase I [Victivallaceae bacterium]|nr:signal peptidase I [Victivallaceae bacterium]
MIGLVKYLLMRRRVGKFLTAARRRRSFDNDLWSAEVLAAVDGFISSGDAALASRDRAALAGFASDMESVLAGLVPPVPRFRAMMREYMDIFAVVMAVAFGIRALALQPFIIPTGSMQPTLFGIHYVDHGTDYFNAGTRYPALANYLLFSATRAWAVTVGSGYFNPTSLKPVSGWVPRTSFVVGEDSYTLPGEPAKVVQYAKLSPALPLPEGAVLADGFLVGGDSLFVERISHLFSGLSRGDIVVFNTEGLSYNNRPLSLISGYYYVKRLVGLPGDTLKIVDGMLYVKPTRESAFRPITDFSGKFDKIFSGTGGYQGYQNGPAGFFLSSADDTYTVPDDCYFMLGDNTSHSLDSRWWGPVPRRNIVGKAFVVFWPFSRRWGKMDASPIPVPSSNEINPMNLQ